MRTDTITLTQNGLRLRGPRRPARNDCIGCYVEVIDAMGRTPNEAWSDAVSLAYGVYGSFPNEDGTVGQCVQLYGADGRKRALPTHGRVFDFSINLYGQKRGDVWARIDSAESAVAA